MVSTHWSCCKSSLPKNPEWGIYRDETDGEKAYIFGGEYQTGTVPSYMKTLYQHDVPCVVCLVRKRSVVQMFPGEKYSCKCNNEKINNKHQMDCLFNFLV